jgi:hypothetical protein
MHSKWSLLVVVTSAILLLVMLWIEYELWTWKPGGSMLFDFPISEFSYLFVCSISFIPIFVYVLADNRRMEGIKLITCVTLVLLTVWGPLRFILFLMFPP